jgi:RNA-directed DNA polymerase
MISYSASSITIYLTLASTFFKLFVMKHSEISTVKQLANYLRCSEESIDKTIKNDFKIIDKTERDFLETLFNATSEETLIQKINIKKKGKISGFRTVYAIRTFQLSDTLKILNNYLNDIFTPLDCVHGFVPGKSTKTNAKVHLAKKIVLSVDIKNFFESITKKMISESLMEIGFNGNVAEWISCITTINGHLVQGFNTSPTIANIVTDKMDKDLLKICSSNINYSRYADDLYFSTDETLPNLDDIENIIEKYNFTLNETKTKIMKRGNFQFVTGLTVFDKHIPRIPKKIKRNIRLEIYYILKFGYEKHAIKRLENSGIPLDSIDSQFFIEEEISETNRRLFGWLHYIKSIEPKFASIYYKQLYEAER